MHAALWPVVPGRELEKDHLDCVINTRLDPGTTALDGYTLAVSTRLPRLLHRREGD